MKFEIRSSLFILLLSTFNLLANAESCKPDSRDNCINPVATGTREFEFEPLFPDGGNVTYGYDVQSKNEAGEGSEPIAKGGIWVSYPKSNLSSKDDMVTELVLILNETITGTPGGGNGGCDDIWTVECSSNLTTFVKYMYTQVPKPESSDRQGTRWLRAFNSTAILDNGQARRVMCPTPALGALPFGNPHVLALEGKDNQEMSYKGNASYTEVYSTFQIGRFDLEKAADVVSVTMLVRASVDQKLYKDPDNIQVEMMCIKPTKRVEGAENPEGEPETTEPPDSAAVSHFTSIDQSILWPTIILTFMTAMGRVFI